MDTLGTEVSCLFKGSIYTEKAYLGSLSALCLAVGFAFVQFVSYYSASRALATVNGREIGGRTVAVDWVVPRNKYQQSLREQPMEEGHTTETQGMNIGYVYM